MAQKKSIKGQKTYTKHTHQTKYGTKRTPLKTGGKFR